MKMQTESPRVNRRAPGIIIKALFGASLLTTLAVSPAAAQATKDLKDEISQSDKAARVFKEIMDAPDKGIPQWILDKAECVAVFPNVLKAGFGVGGRGGRGVASCRTTVRMERACVLQPGRRQHRPADRRAVHRLRDAVHEHRRDEESVVR